MRSNFRSGLFLIVIFFVILACNAPKDRTTPMSPVESTGEPAEPAGTPALPSLAPRQPGQFFTYYIRSDGGTPAQCSGLKNAAYPGSGQAQPCAWNHPFWALPPGGAALIQGGDTLIIGPGSYRMGYGAPGTSGLDACDSGGRWDCYAAPLPSGPDAAHPTRLLGEGWESGCPSPPQLWGAERSNLVLNLTRTNNALVSCLEITDHSSCVEDHTGKLPCNRTTPPFGDWAAVGLYAADSANVTLRDLRIHGLATRGVQAGRLKDWTVERVSITANGSAGWDFDLTGDGTQSASSGTLTFRHLRVEWNGCGESYPEGKPAGCWGQSAGGYGDGFGMGATSAGHWIIEDSQFLYNTSDGIDMLYTRLPGSLVEIRRVEVRGNAGNQIKTTGPVNIENSLIVSNCGFFRGKSFTFDVDDCRAAGDALVLALRPGDQAHITHTTVTGQGTCLMTTLCALGQKCNGGEVIQVRNSLFQGQPRFESPGDRTCFAWYNDESGDTLPKSPFQIVSSLSFGSDFGNVTPDCSGAHNLCEVNPGLVQPAIDTFDAHLQPGSPAIGAGAAEFSLPVDLEQRPRPANTPPDLGAYTK